MCCSGLSVVWPDFVPIYYTAHMPLQSLGKGCCWCNNRLLHTISKNLMFLLCKKVILIIIFRSGMLCVFKTNIKTCPILLLDSIWFLAAVLSRSQDRLKYVSLCTSMLTGGLFWLQGPRCWEQMWISQQRQPLNAEGRKPKTEYDYSEPSFKHLLFSFCENTHTPISSIVSANIKNDTYRQTSQQKQTKTQTKNSLQNITGISENVKRMRIRLWCSGSAILDHNTPSRR